MKRLLTCFKKSILNLFKCKVFNVYHKKQNPLYQRGCLIITKASAGYLFVYPNGCLFNNDVVTVAASNVLVCCKHACYNNNITHRCSLLCGNGYIITSGLAGAVLKMEPVLSNYICVKLDHLSSDRYLLAFQFVLLGEQFFNRIS